MSARFSAAMPLFFVFFQQNAGQAVLHGPPTPFDARIKPPGQ